MPGLIFHGPKQRQVLVRVHQTSTATGAALPIPWDGDGENRLDEEYLLSGGKYKHVAESKTENPSKKETLALDPQSKPADFFENIWQSEDEIKSLHRAHIQQGSQVEDVEDILSFDPDEKILCKLRCKAIINTPSASRDLVGKCTVIVTQLGGATSELRQRRIYYLQV